MALLPNVVTPITPAELATALVAAWRDLLEETPGRRSILILLAQSAHETGRWKYVHCFNLGNVKGRDGDGRDYTMFRCREVVDGKNVWFNPPHPATRFRAYRTLAEGAIDHLAFLHGMKRYAAAWSALEAGSPRPFVAALKAGGYFTDGEDVYARAVSSFYAEFDRVVPLELEPPGVDPETAARAQALVALSLRELGRTEPAPPSDTGIG